MQRKNGYWILFHGNRYSHFFMNANIMQKNQKGNKNRARKHFFFEYYKMHIRYVMETLLNSGDKLKEISNNIRLAHKYVYL